MWNISSNYFFYKVSGMEWVEDEAFRGCLSYTIISGQDIKSTNFVFLISINNLIVSSMHMKGVKITWLVQML